jgi:hypothetical protein
MMRDFRKNYWVLLAFFLAAFFSSFQQKRTGNQNPLSAIKLSFINNVNGGKISFNDSTYTNSFGENYTITKLRYYVTNISLQSGPQSVKEKNSYHLIDENKAESQVVKFLIPEGDYNAIQFLLGVDSLHNVSGAQTDALDPANDMFWTWNTGYVMAKMEGNSSSSKQVNNKFEFHIGGFSGPFNVLQRILLDFPGETYRFVAGKNYEVTINADINDWWQHPHDIKISEHAIITSPGKLAKEISENYAKMFHIEKIISE